MDGRHRWWRLLLPISLLLMAGMAKADSRPPTDNQLWDETRLIYELNPRLDFFAASEFRVTQDFNEFGRASGRGGLSWQATPSFTVTPSYLYEVVDPASDESLAENRLCLQMAYRLPVKTATLTLQNTTEFRMPEASPSAWWIRPKIVVSHPIGPDDLGLNAYVANEVFYDNGRNVFPTDRVFAGFEKKIGTQAAVELYYCREISFQDSARDINVIGINVRLFFGPKAEPIPYEPDSD